MNVSIELVILAIMLLFVLLFFVIGTEATIPVFVRTEFDNIGSYYLAKLQTDGGISQADKNQITNRLMNLGFINIAITAPEKVDWGQEAQLTIRADYIVTETKADFSKSQKSLSAAFHETTIVMTLNR